MCSDFKSKLGVFFDAPFVQRHRLALTAVAVFGVTPKRAKTECTFEFGPASLRMQASAYLSALVERAAAAGDYDHLPLEVVDATFGKGLPCAAEDIRRWLAEDAGKTRPAYRVPESLRLFAPAVPDDAEQKIVQRFSPLYRGVFA